MMRRILLSSRYLVYVAILGCLVSSLALMAYEALVVVSAIVDMVSQGTISPKSAKTLAVGLIEAVDVFLISIAVYLISLGLYTLFVDDTLPLRPWLQVKNLDDLKANLVSMVVVVLAVLFLREAVAWDGSRDLLAFGGALAVVMLVLTLFLKKGGGSKD